MPLSIKDPTTEELTRKLAALTGESLTDAVRTAVEERYHRLQEAKKKRKFIEDLTQIAREVAQLPKVSAMTDDEILGYDEFGAPTR